MIPLRDATPRFSTPYITYFLIILNVVVFLYEAMLGAPSHAALNALLFQFGVVPRVDTAILAGSTALSPALAVIPLFTSMFLHGSWMHVIGNMWFLQIFGDNIEDYLGHFKYLVFYLLAGVLAMLTQFLVNPNSGVPTLGASGAIAGVLGAYFILYPKARVLTWFFVFVLWIPAWIILGYWFVLQFLSGAATSLTYEGHNVGGVAFWAHVGGFVGGAIMIKLFPERRRRSPYAYE